MPLVTSRMMTSASTRTVNGKRYKTSQVSLYTDQCLLEQLPAPCARRPGDPRRQLSIHRFINSETRRSSLFFLKVLKPPFHRFEVRTCNPSEQRGLHAATLWGGTRASRTGPRHAHPTPAFSQTHTHTHSAVSFSLICLVQKH